MMRLTLTAGIAVVSCTGYGFSHPSKQADPKISLTVQATNAASALQQLGALCKTQLLTSPQTADEIVTFRLKDAPLSEVMKRVAEAVDGAWRPEGDSYRLIRTADQQRAERDTEFDEDVKRIQKAIRKRADELAKMRPWSSAEADTLATRIQALVKSFNPNSGQSTFYQQATQLSQQAPIGRAMARIAAMMDPKELAGLPPNIKTVWSSNPTPTQRPLPSGIQPVVEQYVANQLEWSSAVEKRHLAPPTFGGTTYWVGDFGDFQQFNSSGRIAVVLLTAQKWGRTTALNLELAAYDEKGKKVGQAASNLSSDYQDYLDAMKDSPVPPGEEPIRMEADAVALLNGRTPSNQSGGKPLPSDTVTKVLYPESYDPLRFFMSSSLVQAAEIKGVNMVSCLADNAFYSGIMGAAKDVAVDKFLQRLTYFNTQVRLKDGWLVAKPRRPNQTREDRVDRKALGQYLRRAVTGKELSIDEEAAFALSLPDQQTNYLPQVMSGFLNSRMDLFDVNMLRLYGMSTHEQRIRMSADGLPFGSLTERQLDCVNKLVYGPNAYLQFNPPMNDRQTGPQIDFNLYYNGLLHETTESLPDGIPARGVLKLKTESSFVVVASSPQSSTLPRTPGRTLDPSSLAWQKFSQDHPDLFPWMQQEWQRVDLAHVQFGRRLQLTFTFQFTPNLFLVQSFEDRSGADFRTITLDELPDDFKKQFGDAYENLKQSYANAKPGQFGNPGRGGNPPP